jgi:hypothetical protein
MVKPGPMVPWELECQHDKCTAPECDCPAAAPLMDDFNFNLNITELMRTADRRDFLCANVPVCHSCGHEQVQLLGVVQPALWRCRACKHHFTHEPKSQ